MGGKRHKGIGFNRARKKRVVEAEPAPAAVESINGAEIPAPMPPSQSPCPSQEHAQVQASAPAPSAGMDPRDEVFERALVAHRNYMKAKRAWNRSFKTHYGSHTYSMWDEPSVVERCLQRMRQADTQLKETEAKLTKVKREYSLVNAFVQLEKSAPSSR